MCPIGIVISKERNKSIKDQRKDAYDKIVDQIIIVGCFTIYKAKVKKKA